MQTLTFTQKLLRQRRFASYFIPLLALFLGLGSVQMVSAQGTNTDRVTIFARSTATSSSATQAYDGTSPDVPVNPVFQGAVLGTNISQTGGALNLTIAFNDVNTLATRPILSSLLEYRVYTTGATTIPGYKSLNLPRTSTTDIGASVTLEESNAPINLLTQPAVLGGGSYTVEIRFATTRKNGTGTAVFYDGPYFATFTVTPPPTTPAGGSTRWIGSNSNNPNWLDPLNWSNGVPTRDSNANIPGHATSDPFTVAPVLNDPNVLYEVQTLTLENPASTERAIVVVGQTNGATLRIYGDLNNLGGGLSGAVTGTLGTANPATNSTVVLAGDALSFTLDVNGNKVLTGGKQAVQGLTIMPDVRIEGTGIKGVVGVIECTNAFTFNTTNAIVRTVFANDPTFNINTSKLANVNLRSTGYLFGETNNAFIDGITLAERALKSGVTQTFGNIGIDITPDRDNSTVAVVRTVGAFYITPSNAVSVNRHYELASGVGSGVISTVTLHYLASTTELNTIPESNLTIFKTTNNGVPFQLVGGVYNSSIKTVTKAVVGLTDGLIFTLGDKDKPLPVTLTSFDAKRVGADAVVTWETASEVNNKGFNVQVSIDGKEFRTIGFVASASPNSIRATTYSYTDTEKNKSGLRYYRLMQVDTDGTTASFTPRVVSFAGKASANAVVAYPNPFNSNDQLRVSLQAATAGKGQLVVTDMTGRTIRNEAIEVLAGTSDFALNNMADLKSGLYLIKLILPSGETKNLKVVKQ